MSCVLLLERCPGGPGPHKQERYLFAETGPLEWDTSSWVERMFVGEKSVQGQVGWQDGCHGQVDLVSGTGPRGANRVPVATLLSARVPGSRFRGGVRLLEFLRGFPGPRSGRTDGRAHPK